MKTRKPKDSDAIMFLRFLWEHGSAKMGHSWERINSKMWAGLVLAIESGLEFEPDDMTIIMDGSGYSPHKCDGFRGGKWIGVCIEELYRLACAEGKHRSPSPTAIAMLEKYLRREPFILATCRNKSGKRLVVGSRFDWFVGRGKAKERKCLRVTSFADDQKSLVACSYKKGPEGKHCEACGHYEEPYSREKIEKRVKVTLEALREHNKVVRAALKEEK